MIYKKTILITGAAGFVGANLIRELVQHNNQVHIFIRKSSNLWRLNDILTKIKIYNISLEDFKKIEKFVKKINPRIIFHLAASGCYPEQTDPFPMIKTNILGSANLILATKDIDYDCFINTGSSSEYGFKNKPMKENDLLEPQSFYAVTKASGTYFCSLFAKSFNKPIITLRPFSVYGPFEEPTRFIPTVITNTINKKTVKLTPRNARRDFIFIKDLVDCFTYIPNIMNKKIFGEVFNLGTGKQYSNEEVVEQIRKTLKIKMVVEKGAYNNRVWDNAYWVADITKTKNILKWKSQYSLAKGIKETVKWFQSYGQFNKIYAK